MQLPFQDRREAGRILGARLSAYGGRDDVVVLALPRGGVPVGYEVAVLLGAPLDVFLVRKLGVPGHEELAMGAIASGGVRVLHREVVEGLGIPSEVVDAVAREEGEELSRREKAYRGSGAPAGIAGKTVILVDDGLATGSSMRAAIKGVRARGPARVVVAVPVGARETCGALEGEADEIVCGIEPDPLWSVGSWYEDFSQTTDEEVRGLLALANRRGREQPAEA